MKSASYASYLIIIAFLLSITVEFVLAAPILPSIEELREINNIPSDFTYLGRGTFNVAFRSQQRGVVWKIPSVHPKARHLYGNGAPELIAPTVVRTMNQLAQALNPQLQKIRVRLLRANNPQPGIIETIYVPGTQLSQSDFDSPHFERLKLRKRINYSARLAASNLDLFGPIIRHTPTISQTRESLYVMADGAPQNFLLRHNGWLIGIDPLMVSQEINKIGVPVLALGSGNATEIHDQSSDFYRLVLQDLDLLQPAKIRGTQRVVSIGSGVINGMLDGGGKSILYGTLLPDGTDDIASEIVENRHFWTLYASPFVSATSPYLLELGGPISYGAVLAGGGIYSRSWAQSHPDEVGRMFFKYIKEGGSKNIDQWMSETFDTDTRVYMHEF